MKQKTKVTIFISLLSVLLVSTISAGFYLFNKGAVDIKGSKGISVNANDLYTIYSYDSLTANKKYTSRILVVRGVVSEISINSKQQKIILVKTAAPGAYVNCTLEEPADNINVSDNISIKGICSGIGQGDAELGIKGDVYLTRCFVSQ